MANGTDKLDRIEKLLETLAGDVGSVKRELGGLQLTEARHFKQVAGELEALGQSVGRLQSDQAHLAGAVSIAVSQLALAQSIIKRLERVEAAIFPSKHQASARCGAIRPLIA